MPNSINIVSPVSGETVLASSILDVAIDYEYMYSGAYVGAECSSATAHNNTTGPVSGASSASVELGTHASAATGVTIEARLLPTNVWGGFYVNHSVNNITISTDPPVVIDPPASFAHSTVPYYYMDEVAAEDFRNRETVGPVNKLWRINFGRDYDTKLDALKKNHHYDPTDPNGHKLTGKIKAGFRDGSLTAVVSGKLGKTGLIHVYTVPKSDITINPGTGEWEIKIPIKVLNKSHAPRQIIVTLFDKNDEAVAMASAALKKK